MSETEAARFELFIDGAETPSASGARATLTDPATGAPIASVAVGGRDDARYAMEVADRAFRESAWAQEDQGAQRAKALRRLAERLEAAHEAFARLETLNMGKTLREARGDIGYVVRTLEYAGALAETIEGSTIPVPGPRFDYTLRQPLGVTVHIAPWNYPLLLAIRSVAPALAAGNAVVLKPASLTPLTALAFARLAHEAGLPKGILNVVVGPGREVGEALVEDPRCRSVSFTGSAEVGERLGAIAGRRHVPQILELGGKSPVVVLPDADLDRAARGIAFGIFGNAGQMCWAGSRAIVHESVRAPLLERVRGLAERMRLGPGLSDASEMGPMVSAEQRERVVGFIEGARAAGGTVVTGGGPPSDPALATGHFLRPTVLDRVPPGDPAVREEIFGPVLTVFGFEDPEEAIRLANDTRYGLFAAVWTKDLGSAHTFARRLEAGMVCINESPNTFPQTPFAGIKDSGLGAEQGRESVLAYTRVKNVLIHLGGGGKRPARAP
ncbi:MAG: aldehyde dehydrogenase family protein [Thermoplasmata archaeon]